MIQIIDIRAIDTSYKGKYTAIHGIVEQVVQTGGPTLFTVSDGTGSMKVKAFDGPGVRAYPQIQMGDAVEAQLLIKEYEGTLEGECRSLIPLTKPQADSLRVSIDKKRQQQAAPKGDSFIINSPLLDKLKESFVRAATLIKMAVLNNRPIIVRHHNDTDGYCSGYALERAILGMIADHHGTDKSLWQYFSRAPCAAPFYEIEDSMKDAARALGDAARFSQKMPLVIIADNGSSHEDLLSIRQGKALGMDFIVIDHHYFPEDVISSEVLVHINPFLVGEDGSRFSAGMLCAELAVLINPDLKASLGYLPLLAGLADHIDNVEALDAYRVVAHHQGYQEDQLGKLSRIIDYASAKLRFMEGREYYDVLFGSDKAKQSKLIELFDPALDQMEKKGLAIAQSQVRQEHIGDILVQFLDIEASFSRGSYPKPGRCNGLLHDHASKSHKRVVSVGMLSDVFTMRATDEANFSVHDFLRALQEKVPEAFADGGGHKNAGSIKFVPALRDQVIQVFKEFVESRV